MWYDRYSVWAGKGFPGRVLYTGERGGVSMNRKCIFKRAASVFLALSAMLCLTSCSQLRALQLTGMMSEEAEKIHSMSEEIIRCLTEHDREGLKELFCDRVKENEELDGQIEELMEFVQCDVYLSADIEDSASGGQSIESGEITDWTVRPQIPYVKVQVASEEEDGRDAVRYYKVAYGWKITDKEDPSMEGLHWIEAELLNMDEKVWIGTNGFLNDAEDLQEQSGSEV